MEFLRLLEGLRTPFMDTLMSLITQLGDELFFMVIAITMFWCIDKRRGYYLLSVSFVGTLINQFLKLWFRIPRPWVLDPDFTIVESAREAATGYSFPSGHTQNFATWSTLIALKIKKLSVWIVTAMLILLVAFSRMFLGAHYPMDVVAGALLGVLFSVVGNAIYDKTEDKNRLFLWATVIFTPFIIWFVIFPNPLYADFFKVYGMIAGAFAGLKFEEKYSPLSYNVPIFKKVIRVVLGIMIALVFKAGLKTLFATDIVRLGLICDALRYFILLFIMVGLCPLLFKKLNL